ncbi:hypothetical protein [Cryobacterium lyxosi]|uniref:Uncharacterized protein n=1 Tax=Cryobacterium lyxosi TaxID=1259228 RepID=A0A4V3IPG7_9MICO|nr:hypothetical protein [Cryobacterium lyxosi]TFD28671.1 hypothetical protein E3T27_01920 [Cryobacterium lyxosi]
MDESRVRTLGTLIAIARTRVAADRKIGVETPAGISALARVTSDWHATSHEPHGTLLAEQNRGEEAGA